MEDPVRDLNNYLQGLPGGSLAKDLKWVLQREGPEHGVTYHFTAICKHSFGAFVTNHCNFFFHCS